MSLATGSVVTSNDLIVFAMETIQELGIGEVPDDYMLSRGLLLLNELLGEFTASTIYIPYLTTVKFDMVQGQSTYTVSNINQGVGFIDGMQIVEIVYANYTYPQEPNGGMIYPLNIMQENNYYTMSRQATLNTLPGGVFLNNQFGQSQLVFYPAPSGAFTVTLQCKCFLTRLEAQTQLQQLPPYYYGFMRLALARKLRGLYPSSQWGDTNEDEYQRTFNTLKSANKTNVNINASTMLSNPGPYWQSILTVGA